MCECKREMTREELSACNNELINQVANLKAEKERLENVIEQLDSALKDNFGVTHEDFQNHLELLNFMKSKAIAFREEIKCLQDELSISNVELRECKEENEKLKSRLCNQDNNEQSHLIYENELRTALLVVTDELSRLRMLKGL